MVKKSHPQTILLAKASPQDAPYIKRPNKGHVRQAWARGEYCGMAFLSPCETYAWQPTHDGRVIKVSLEDARLLSNYLWSVNQKGYVSRIDQETQKRILLHRVILGLSDRLVFVDHEQHDTLDNRREKIRICTPSESMYNQGKTTKNTSGYKGVSKYRWGPGWLAYIWHERKQKHIGVFATKELAAAAYDKAAKRLHGSFAQLNLT